MMSENPHIGPAFDDFLAEQGMADEVNAVAVKRVLAWQIETLMREQHISKTAMAKRLATSRAAVDRLLDPANDAITLQTLLKVAQTLGKRLSLRFV